MRVIAGIAKGRKLRAPGGYNTRPTLDRVKQSLFDILGCRVIDARVLDLYAGSGTLGIEALSRGASFAVFVDLSSEAVRVINENLTSCGFMEKAEVHRSDVGRAIGILEKRGLIFDLIFVDPPYGQGLADRTLMRLGSSKVLAMDALVVVRHRHKEDMPGEAGVLNLVRREYYGETTVSLYGRKVGIELENSGMSREL